MIKKHTEVLLELSQALRKTINSLSNVNRSLLQDTAGTMHARSLSFLDDLKVKCDLVRAAAIPVSIAYQQTIATTSIQASATQSIVQAPTPTAFNWDSIVTTPVATAPPPSKPAKATNPTVTLTTQVTEESCLQEVIKLEFVSSYCAF